MKTIKINFTGFWKSFDVENNFITSILEKHYRVEISDDPDYLFCSCFGFYDYLDHQKIRIMFSGENYTPDFNYMDYGLSVYPIQFLDRHFTFPGILLSRFDSLLELSNKKREYSANILKEKPMFANMIASHECQGGFRGDLMRLLGQYRRVEAAGSYLNNMPDNACVQMEDGSKVALQKKCKFTICPESVVHEGFVTEKIFDAFLSDTIPIYYGSSTITSIFNSKAFINVRDYDSLQDVLERVIELDRDDEKYLEMLNQPIFTDENYVEKSLKGMEAFLCHIIDQPIEQAYRRCKQHTPAEHEETLKECMRRGFSYMATQYFAVKDAYLEFKKKIIG